MSRQACVMKSLLVSLSVAVPAAAQVVIPGADGSDGAFSPASNVTIDLALADVGAWDGPNPNPGEGVYDPEKWAVVFRYSSVNIPSGVTVSFRNRNYLVDGPNPPVVWLVDGPVTIAGTVSLVPVNEADPLNFYRGGPGGFRGSGPNYIGGLGPGGRDINQTSFYGSNGYGNARCIPLIGGSGGSYHTNSAQGVGGGGGGAILLASSGTMTLNGTVNASVGFRRTTGGTIRIVCNRLQGTGTLIAQDYNDTGDFGRIRVEANELAFGSVGSPIASVGLPGTTAALWPEDLTLSPPRARVVTLGPEAIPADPAASFAFPQADVNVTNGMQILTIECENVPTGSDPPGTPAWNVVARVVPRGVNSFTVNATFISGDFALSTWQATLNLPPGFSAVQVRASMPPP